MMDTLEKNDVDVSVIICTRDRAESLGRALNSFRQIIIPPKLSWELLVIDNGSTDRTSDVVESFSSCLPIRRVFEEKAGLSNARNRGVLAVRGRNIVWTDDDVEVHPEWLKAYVDAFEEFPDVTLFGGVSAPVFEQPTQDWIEPNMHLIHDLLAVRSFGSAPIAMSLSDGSVPFGLNYAVRSDVQRQFLYDTDLGVAPNRRISGEEIDFYERVLGAGYSGLCLPGPAVSHHIPLSRQTIDYARSYYSSAGETAAIRRYRKGALKLHEYGVVFAKFVVARLLKIVTSKLGTRSVVLAAIRDAFHTGRVRRFRQLMRADSGAAI